MVKRIIASSVALLAVSAGVAYAATQLASSEPTQVCVNDVTGLMRADDSCRQGEHAITIGGGGEVQVTQNGTFTVGFGETSTTTTLPLTGVTVAGKCEVYTYTPDPPAPPYDIGLARILFETSSGTMDAFAAGSAGTLNGSSLLTVPATSSPVGGGTTWGSGFATVTANGATATITYGAQVNGVAETCTYLWQAVEAPNEEHRG